jgi:hypothetical protein
MERSDNEQLSTITICQYWIRVKLDRILNSTQMLLDILAIVTFALLTANNHSENRSGRARA